MLLFVNFCLKGGASAPPYTPLPTGLEWRSTDTNCKRIWWLQGNEKGWKSTTCLSECLFGVCKRKRQKPRLKYTLKPYMTRWNRKAKFNGCYPKFTIGNCTYWERCQRNGTFWHAANTKWIGNLMTDFFFSMIFLHKCKDIQNSGEH